PLAEQEGVVLQERFEEAALLLLAAGRRDQVAPLPALAEGLRDGAVGLGEFRHDQRLGHEIGALAAPFLGNGHGAKAELGAFLDDLPVERLARIGDLVALERDRADFLFREFARRHLPGALLVAQGKVHGISPRFIRLRARRRSLAGDSAPAPRRCAAWHRRCPRRNAGRRARRARIAATACLDSRQGRRSIPPRPWRRGRSLRRRTRRRWWSAAGREGCDRRTRPGGPTPRPPAKWRRARLRAVSRSRRALIRSPGAR